MTILQIVGLFGTPIAALLMAGFVLWIDRRKQTTHGR